MTSNAFPAMVWIPVFKSLRPIERQISIKKSVMDPMYETSHFLRGRNRFERPKSVRLSLDLDAEQRELLSLAVSGMAGQYMEGRYRHVVAFSNDWVLTETEEDTLRTLMRGVVVKLLALGIRSQRPRVFPTRGLNWHYARLASSDGTSVREAGPSADTQAGDGFRMTVELSENAFLPSFRSGILLEAGLFDIENGFRPL